MDITTVNRRFHATRFTKPLAESQLTYPFAFLGSISCFFFSNAPICSMVAPAAGITLVQWARTPLSNCFTTLYTLAARAAGFLTGFLAADIWRTPMITTRRVAEVILLAMN